MDPDWIEPADLKRATIAQRAIADACEIQDRIDPVSVLAGADVSMKWRDSRGPIHAAIAPIGWPSCTRADVGGATRPSRLPYIPGYLGFREVPALVEAWRALSALPQLVVVDGHGRSHPRRCGVATHLGVVLDVPTIGCAKTLLCGRLEGPLGAEAGSRTALIDRGERVGFALRTRVRCNPVYVSTGHRVSLDTAVDWVMALAGGRRLPLPIRLAHDAANALRRSGEQSDVSVPGSLL